MFNWVCPRCGRDVPPSKTDCPYCPAPSEAPAALATETQQIPEQAPPYIPPPPPPQYSAPPPQQYTPQQHSAPAQYAAQAPPQQFVQQHQPPAYPPPQNAHPGAPQQYAPPQYWPPPGAKPPLPTWLMALLFGIAFSVLFAGGYYLLQRHGGSADKGLENPSNASKQKLSNPLQKYIEVVGIRIVTEKKVQMARFMVVNHAGVEMTDLVADVTLWASTSRSEEDAVGTFSFKLDSIGANDAKELSAPLKTKLRAFELPDWQNTTAEVQLTSP